jgi:DNA polymerase III alpha subunit
MFVQLHCHSQYSFLRAVPSPQELIDAAAGQARSGGPARDGSHALPATLRGGAVALTDTNGLYAAVPFYQAARHAGVKPILGAELDFTFDISHCTSARGHHADRSKDRPPHVAPLNTEDDAEAPFGSPSGAENPQGNQRTRRSAGNRKYDYVDPGTLRAAFEFEEHETHKAETWHGPRLVLLAQNAAGYGNLCRLVSQRHIEERPVTLAELNERREGLVALYLPTKGGTRSRELGTKLETRSGAAGAGAFSSHSPLTTGHLKDIFGAAFFLEARRLAPGDGRAFRETLKLAQELGVPVVATNNVHFLKPEEHLHHRVLNAIRTGSLLTAIAPGEITTPEAYFKSAAEMQRAFPDHPEVLGRTISIAEQCHLELALGQTIFPEFPVPAGETPFSYLWKLCFAGAQRRYQPLHPEALRRLTHELEVIHKLHLAPYFLLVWDIVEEARRRGIPAVARGSAASSIVTYCLGISRVCPLRWNLYFERFLNEQRGDIPDIDLDICGARRDELLDYVYQRWGRKYVAMIGSFITMHARMAVREVAKVFGVPHAEVNQFTRRLPHRPVREILQAMRTLPECRALPAAEEPWKTILQVALRLDDFPRHLGIHPCGTVIAPPRSGGLTSLVPLEWAAKGIVVTQYDMHAVEALGLVKMDLLGQRGLTTMSLALRNIANTALPPGPLQSDVSHAQSPVDFDAIPENDPATCAMLARGQTLGLFQIESPGMRGLLRALGARHWRSAGLAVSTHDPAALQARASFSLEEISLALALIRPGASEYGSKESFLRRIRGAERVTYPHPRLEPILRDTLGICVYQEQVMQIAQAAGGMSLAESDLVRRASAKFADDRERQRLRSKFLKSAEQLGLEGAAREAAWQMVEKFAGFGFCKAHAATYADISYRMAYLKAHYPAAFLAAMCSSGAGFYHVSAYVEEAKRLGIEVRLPSVNRSQVEYTAEPLESDDPRATSVPGRPREAGFACESGSKLAHCTAMRIGLLQVRGLRAETMARIVHSRNNDGPYRSLEDFLRRVPIAQDEIEALIKCGAFDDAGLAPVVRTGEPSRPVHPADAENVQNIKGRTGQDVCPTTRPALLWQLHFYAPPQAEPCAAGRLFPDAPPERPAQPASAYAAGDYTREQRMRYEQEILEVCVSGHPLDLVPRNGENWSTDLLRTAGILPAPSCDEQQPRLSIGKRVVLLGWVITYRRVGTRTYRNMMFVTLEDQRGVYEAVLFPEVYERYGGLVFESRLLRVTGRIEAEATVRCEQLEALRL